MKWRVMWYKQKPDCFYARWVRYFDRHFQARDFAAVTNKFWPERSASVEYVEYCDGETQGDVPALRTAENQSDSGPVLAVL